MQDVHRMLYHDDFFVASAQSAALQSPNPGSDHQPVLVSTSRVASSSRHEPTLVKLQETDV